MAGHVPIPVSHRSLCERFPALTAAIGNERVEGLVASSFLVGMVCPGLHSIYRSLTLSMIPIDGSPLRFRVTYADPDYRFVRIATSGSGWGGVIDTNMRPPPTLQSDLSSLAKLIDPGEFSRITALVVGGSRGLGELIAKILAAGGARVTVTYAVGRSDAIRVQAEILASGAHCDIIRFDVKEAPGVQLESLQEAPNQVYYMATPTIFRRPGKPFILQRFQDFLAYYVVGFDDLCQSLRTRFGSDIAVFYPSSASLDDRPSNMTEYTMAKAAGEVLCADMKSFDKWANLVVARLPRLPTDQTASLFDEDEQDPVAVMLPIVRQMCIQEARGTVAADAVASSSST